MNETLRTLKERRSIRQYKKEQINEEQLNLILEAGTYAPSGMGRQSAIMVVVQDPELIQKLSGSMPDSPVTLTGIPSMGHRL